jgi:hypothetical protein
MSRTKNEISWQLIGLQSERDRIQSEIDELLDEWKRLEEEDEKEKEKEPEKLASDEEND